MNLLKQLRNSVLREPHAKNPSPASRRRVPQRAHTPEIARGAGPRRRALGCSQLRKNAPAARPEGGSLLAHLDAAATNLTRYPHVSV